MCFFAVVARVHLFRVPDGRSTARKISTLRSVYKHIITSPHLASFVRSSHVNRARGELLLLLKLLKFSPRAFLCIFEKNNGASALGNVPLGRANSVRIGLLGWLVHVVVFECERDECEGGW